MATIAHYSSRRTWLYVCGGLIFLVVFLIATLHHPANVPLKEYIESKGAFRFPAVVLGWAAAALLFGKLAVLVFQLIVDDRRAIWIKDHELFYLNVFASTFYRKVSTPEIQEISTVRVHFSDGISLQLRSGVRVSIPMFLLEEDMDTVKSSILDHVVSAKRV